MMSNNKILTVSYGTFSCTLEGFEDSFGTMKAIAEYFRDLAADDRYFGAEPPQPDAEMLARIAQREVTRQVQARQQDGKIVLSALEDKPAPAPQEASSQTAQTPAARPAQAAPAQSSAAPAALAAHAAATAKVDMPDIVPGQPDEEVEAFFAEAAHTGVSYEEEDTPAPAAAPAPPAPEAAAVTKDAESSDALPQETPAESRPAPSRADSIAAKLERIRAVVSQSEDEAEEETESYIEDEDAPQQTDRAMATPEEDDSQSDEIDALLSRLESTEVEASVFDEAEEEIAETAQVADPDFGNLFDEEEDSGDVTIETAPQAAAPVQDTAEDAPDVRVIKVKRADLEAAIEQGDLEEYDFEDEDEDADDLDAADADAAQAEAPSALDALAPAKGDGTSLSADDEAELARELAELDAEIAPQADAEQTPQEDDAAAKAAALAAQEAEEEAAAQAAAAAERRARRRAARAKLPELDEAKDSDMNRLMDETVQQMDEPETATRRDAITHLRAAVAAQKADVAMGKRRDEGKSDDAYRSDLAEVVRPRRPAAVAEGARSERPEPPRPAPLKLVAEQRIDVEQPAAPKGPVRPRRVAAVAEEQTADEGFAEFAEEMGATKLPELLEAAAAYMSFVEGRDQFSRPQLMTKVRQISPEGSFNREDGLRSFGQLLRAGKIEKIKGGRFTASEDIGFRPGERAAG
jgi:hypothetical protein